MPCRFVRTWESFAINNEMRNVIFKAQTTRFLLAFYCSIADSAVLGAAAWAPSSHRWAAYVPQWIQRSCAHPRSSVSPAVSLFVRASDWAPLPSCNQFHMLLVLGKSARWLFVAFVSQKAALDLMELLSRDAAVRRSNIVGPVLVRSRERAPGGRDRHGRWGRRAKGCVNEQHAVQRQRPLCPARFLLPFTLLLRGLHTLQIRQLLVFELFVLQNEPCSLILWETLFCTFPGFQHYFLELEYQGIRTSQMLQIEANLPPCLSFTCLYI